MQLFGTSGIRHVVDNWLIQLTLKLGLAVGNVYGNVVVGGDTRTSSDALKHAFISGLLAGGSRGYAAGELKHGPFALLSSDTPVIAIVAQDNTYEAMLTNIREVKARGSPVIALAEEGDEVIGELVDSVITVPQVDAIFSPVVNTVALQLLAYYTAQQRGCPIDFPQNLAKSVTVE